MLWISAAFWKISPLKAPVAIVPLISSTTCSIIDTAVFHGFSVRVMYACVWFILLEAENRVPTPPSTASWIIRLYTLVPKCTIASCTTVPSSICTCIGTLPAPLEVGKPKDVLTVIPPPFTGTNMLSINSLIACLKFSLLTLIPCWLRAFNEPPGPVKQRK